MIHAGLTIHDGAMIHAGLLIHIDILMLKRSIPWFLLCRPAEEKPGEFLFFLCICLTLPAKSFIRCLDT